MGDSTPKMTCPECKGTGFHPDDTQTVDHKDDKCPKEPLWLHDYAHSDGGRGPVYHFHHCPCIRCNGDGTIDPPEALLKELIGLLTPKKHEIVMEIVAPKTEEPATPRERSYEDLEGDIRYSAGILYGCDTEDCSFDWSGKGQRLVLDFGVGGYIKQTVRGNSKYGIMLELGKILATEISDRKAELEDALNVLKEGE